MSKVIDAIYEQGIFKPIGPVHLPEGARVRVEVLEANDTLTDMIRQRLAAEGAAPEAVERALATLRDLEKCFEGLTEEQRRDLDSAKLDQNRFFIRPED